MREKTNHGGALKAGPPKDRDGNQTSKSAGGSGGGGGHEGTGAAGRSGGDDRGSSGVPAADRGFLAASAVFLALVLLAHAAAYFLLPGWLWGANTLYGLIGVSAVAVMALSALFLVPPVARAALGPIEAAGRNRFLSLFGDRVVALVLAGGVALAAFWGMGVAHPGKNAWLFQYPYYVKQIMAPEAGVSLPIPLDFFVERASGLLDISYSKVARGLVVGLGAAFVCSLVLWPLGSRATRRWGAPSLLLALSGTVLVFLGSRADLAVAVTATAIFVALGTAAIDRRLSPLWAGLAALCAALAHPAALALLPAWSFLVWRGADRRKGLRFWAALAASLAALLALLGLFDIAGRPATASFLTEIRDLWGTGSGTRAGWVLGGIGDGGTLETASKVVGWLVERVWGTVNGLLLVAPVGLALALAAVAGRGWRRLGSPGVFIGFAALATTALAFAASPYPGPPRTWGIYGPAGICATAFGAWWLMEVVGDRRRYRAAVLGCVAMSLMHLLPALPGPSDPRIGVETLSMEASAASPWDVRGRARALEELGAFHLSAGDTLAAAGDLSQAWRAVPNPLYLGTAGAYYASVKRYDLAEEQFTRLVAERPLDAEANLSLGILHEIRGDMEGARRLLLVAYGDTALSLPEPVMDTRAEWEDMAKGPERERLIKDRIRRRNESTEIFLRGDDASKRGLLSAAERQYRQALDVYPTWGRMQFEVHDHIGTIYAMQGRYREAAYELLLAINSFRNYQLCYYIVNGVGYGPVRPQATSPHAPPAAE